MAHIAIITHELDEFALRDYQIKILVPAWTDMGHKVQVVAGIDSPVSADIALLHVDLTFVPPRYVEFTKRFPLVINGAVLDSSKRSYSSILVARDDDWDGAVIAKSNLNSGGVPESIHNEAAMLRGLPAPFPGAQNRASYFVRSHKSKLAPQVWDDPGMVVERFLPEQDEHGYWIRTWVFLGDRERSNRNGADRPIIKGSDMVRREPVEVPEAIRAERVRLKYDYGKFDYVVHNGTPILLDANGTPGAPSNLGALFQSTAGMLAGGINALARLA
jgi:hypothetical protein